jgi:hypothetical protein
VGVLENVNDKKKLYNWLTASISLFREKSKQLSTEEQKVIPFTFYDLLQPCQVLVIWAKKPEYQIFFISHSDKLEDKLIEIYGPIENSKLIEEMTNIILNSKIAKIIRKEIVEDYFIRAIRIIQADFNPLITPSLPDIIDKHQLSSSPHTIGWTVMGKIQDFDTANLIDHIIKDIKLYAEPATVVYQTFPEKEKIILKGFGAYLYPPVWIGEIPKPKSLKEKMGLSPISVTPKDITIKEMYKSHTVILTRDGFIAIEESDLQKAKEYLNEIIGSLLLFCDVQLAPLRETDLGETKVTETAITYNWNPLSQKSFIYEFNNYIPPSERMQINKKIIEKIIRLAELSTSNERIKNLLLLYLDDYTYFKNTEYIQSLIISWVILEEFYIKELWIQEISKKVMNKNQLHKLQNWNTDECIEALYLYDVISPEDYTLLMKVKRARNKTLHEGKTPEQGIVTVSLLLAQTITQAYILKHVNGVENYKDLPFYKTYKYDWEKRWRIWKI